MSNLARVSPTPPEIGPSYPPPQTSDIECGSAQPQHSGVIPMVPFPCLLLFAETSPFLTYEHPLIPLLIPRPFPPLQTFLKRQIVFF